MYWTLPFILFIIWLFGGDKRYKTLYVLYKTLPRDMITAYRYIKLRYQLLQWEKTSETVPKAFRRLLDKHPTKVAFYFEDMPWTFQEIENFSNQVANYFIKQGFVKGDTIALLLENRPEYVGIWLGLAKVGMITALINTNLVSNPLYHSLVVVDSKAIIYGSDFVNNINSIKDRLKDMRLYEFSTKNKVNLSGFNLKEELQKQSISPPEEDIQAVKPKDKFLYIYTSGTTGFPKAAIITHYRYMFSALGLYIMTDLNYTDIFYNPLPLYHSAGGMVSTGQSILFGISVVIRRKFSASNFWNDCQKYKCTVSNYIGETCRYILAAHKNNSKIKHDVKKMVGNGLRKQIWKDFMEEFNVPQIYEFYGATEGNANLINIDNTIGAVGFVPPLATALYPVTLLKCDEESKKPIRNKFGFCIQCQPGEAGLFVGRVSRVNKLNQFVGYADRKETDKKILRNVFRPGDMYFNTGDILVQDQFGYYYFKDRTGDTFRWKGENVATTEVESVTCDIIGLKSVVVYGVEIPGTEGKAGMLTIVDPEKKLSLEELARGLKKNLPSYAIPLFLRLAERLPLTGTFKVRKVELQREGFDINTIKDPMYFFDMKTNKFVPLENVFDDIINERIKL